LQKTNKQAIKSIKLSIPNKQSELLDARLDLPINISATQYAIISHCFTCTKETITTSRVSRGLAQQGIAVLRFDFTGLGKSQGDFSDSNFASMVNDILSVNDFMKKNHQPANILLGHSMGGTAALAASTEIETCASVITIASPSHPSHVLHHFDNALTELEAGNNSEIIVAGTAYPVKPQFISDVRNCNFMDKLSNFRKNILSIRAGRDSLVADNDANEIIKYTSGQHELFDIENADHLFSDRADTEIMINKILDWIS
jgi:alpha/beta superfamily hydrolase